MVRLKRSINASDVQEGDLMAIVQFVKVQKSRRIDTLVVGGIEVNDVDNDLDFSVHGNELVEQMLSADRYVTTTAVPRTDMIEVLMSSFNRPLTAKFIKVDGTNRTVRGRLVKTEPLYGRTIVEDLDKEKKADDNPNWSSRNIQVDHRSLFELIVDGVQYTLKK